MPLLRSFYKGLRWTETDWSSDNYSVFKTAGGMLSIWSIEEMSKDINLPIPENPNFFKGVTLSINTDFTEQVMKSLNWLGVQEPESFMNRMMLFG